jgi:hypothetical protein
MVDLELLAGEVRQSLADSWRALVGRLLWKTPQSLR